MAYYIRTIGLRKTDSIEKEEKLLLKILKSIESYLLEINLAVPTSLDVELTKTEHHKYFELKLIDDSIKIIFDNPNFIEFLGHNGWDIRDFGQTPENRKHIDSLYAVFKKIASEYGIKEIASFPEWFFDPDSIREGEASFEDLEKLIETNPYPEPPKFWEKWTNGYFIEKINPVAIKYI